MRLIHTHQNNEANGNIDLAALDERGAGNANHEYKAEWDGGSHGVYFQNGPVNEAGQNGITNEVLLAIVLDRLRGFQAGNFSCRENALAITNIEQGLHWMNARTKDRVARGVEGESKA